MDNLWIIKLVIVLFSNQLALSLEPSGEPKKDDSGTYLAAEQRLLDDLLGKAYNPALRPSNGNTPINVKLGFGVLNSIALDEKEEKLTLNVWESKFWSDWRLRWNASEYGGITELRIPSDKVWKPDIIPYNSKHSDAYEYVYDALVLVFNSGDVQWIPHLRLHTHCSIDPSHFPFDTQRCALVFGSWTYDGLKVDLNFHEGHAGLYFADYNIRQGNEWIILNSTGTRKVALYDCCEEPYISLNFNLILQRASGYYVNTYVVPSVFILLLAPSMFLLPPATSHKFVLGIGLMISQVLLMDKLADRLPSGYGTLPMIARYYVLCLFTIAASLALSAFFATIKSGLCSCLQQPPSCLRRVSEWSIMRLICIPKNAEDVNYVRMTSETSTDQSAASDVGDKEAIVASSSSTGAAEWCMLVVILDRLLFIILMAFVIVMTVILLTASQV